jgi:transcriptional regulator with XRE-family HTH domain
MPGNSFRSLSAITFQHWACSGIMTHEASSDKLIGKFPRRVDVAPSSSPTVRRRRLAAALLRLRQESKLTIEQVAEQLEWSAGKVSKIENARVSVLPRDARKLLEVYGITEGDERELLLTLAKQSRERGWWQQYGETLPEWFTTYVGLEAEASSISVYQAEIVPGLLQTQRYAAALHRAALMNATEEQIEQHVTVRMERQARFKQPDAPRLWVVLNEAVLRRVIGERAVMHEQLVKLTEAASEPNITLQVLPFSAGAHASMDSAFWILGFEPPTDGDVVYFEHPTCSLYLEKPEEVARYKLVYEHLRAASMPIDESRRLIARCAADLA